MRGQAISKADLVNFYRMLAELLAHNSIYIKVNKEGPVYKKATEVIEFIRAESSGEIEIKQVDNSVLNYANLISNAVQSLEGMDSKLHFSNIKHRKDVSPEFSTSQHPDTSFHEWLTKGKKSFPDYVSSSNNGTYAPILMGTELGLIDTFKKVDRSNWVLEDSIALAAKMRSLIYMEMAKELKLTYIPSATRGYNSDFSFNSPSIRSLLFKDAANFQEFKKNFESNSTVVSGIVIRNGCAPMASFQNAIQLRKQTKALRKTLDKKPWLKKGDALLVYQYAKIKELGEIIRECARSGSVMFDTDALNPTVSADSMQPEFEVSVNAITATVKFAEHIRKRRIAARAKSLIVPIMQADFSNPSKMLKLFKQKAGLHE